MSAIKLEFKMADTKTVKTAYPAYKYCILHISETKGRDLGELLLCT